MSNYTKDEVDEIIKKTKKEISSEMLDFKSSLETQMLSLIETNFPNFEANPFTSLKGLDYVKINNELNFLKQENERLKNEINDLKNNN